MQVLLNEHGDDEGLPSIDWDVAETARAILWPLYVEQMVLQRDSSTAIHLAQSFEKIRLRLTVMVEHLRSRHYADAADALKAKWERHYGYVTSSGVNALSLSLWPTPSLSQLQTQQAIIELNQLIEKQYSFWIDNHSAFPIPADSEYAPPATKDDPIVEASAELSRHLNGSGLAVRRAKEWFLRECASAQSRLEESETPKPHGRKRDATGKSQSDILKYWDAVGFELPVLRFIAVCVLSKCVATEASCERMFSHEGLVHSPVRNQLNPTVVDAMVRVRNKFPVLCPDLVPEEAGEAEIDPDVRITFDVVMIFK